jgi:hypothetical protein
MFVLLDARLYLIDMHNHTVTYRKTKANVTCAFGDFPESD